MPIFKKKVYFPQFLSDVISYQMDFLEKNFDRLIDLADESKVLTDAQRKDFFDKAHELIILDIIVSCNLHFNRKVSSEEMGEVVSIVYGKYLLEYKKIPMELADEKMQRLMGLLELLDKAEEKDQKHDEYAKEIGYERPCKIGNNIDKVKYYVCTAFCDHCVGEDIKSENWQGRQLAALKFSKAVVLSDVVSMYLKNVKVTF
jgi:hypothetical protein